ncbi:hypothetical protein [Streptomyces acidiscabies]|uniref:hypothetical protein n=1 Tax=Streptomyces acidiscabies TaxID=42234 RepID=UPI00073E41C1|nr:hypothetical protein [Streptomyces acidiscabies]GAQ52115.1 hypothetical protein a10_01896 [Streptomyces acidiscabies]
MSFLNCLRQIAKPGTGRRRVAGPPAKPADPTVKLLRPVETLVSDIEYCPAEKRPTLHAWLRTGGRICWTCRTYTETGPLPSFPEADRG